MSGPSSMEGDFSAFDGYIPATPAVADAEVADLDQDDPASHPQAATHAGTDHQADHGDQLTGADEVAETGPPQPPVTGNSRVDAATASLDQLDELPTSQHADVFDEVHRRLQGALADLDAG